MRRLTEPRRVRGGARTWEFLDPPVDADGPSQVSALLQGGGGQAATAAPAFIAHPPAKLSADPGTLATFAAAASGVGVTYSWSKDGNEFPGATQNAFVLPAVSPADAGRYSCHARSGNDEAKSTELELVVNGARMQHQHLSRCC